MGLSDPYSEPRPLHFPLSTPNPRPPLPFPALLRLLRKSELVADQAAKTVPNLRMSWNRRLAAGRRIRVDVVSAAMAVEDASGGLKFSDKLAPFHTKTSICLV